MRGMPAYLVALGVVVVAAAFVYTVTVERSAPTELQNAVESLRNDVAELRIAVNEVKTTLLDERAATGRHPEAPDTDGAPKHAVSPGGEAIADSALLEDENVNVDPIDVVLKIAADHTITLNGQVLGTDELEDGLKRLLKTNPAMQLIVKADESVPASEIQEVMDAAKRVGIGRLTLGTTPTE